MHLEPGQKQTLADNVKSFMKAKRLTLTSMAKHGVSWQTAKNLTEAKVGKYITTGLTQRLEKLTGKSLGALITDSIDWPNGELRGGKKKRAYLRTAPRAARVEMDMKKMFIVQYADGTEVAVPVGVKISITGPHSIKVG